jgi:propanol-preferring alcohol dehydrogenase
MLAVKIPGKDTIKIVEEKKPVPKKNEVLIKMKASALCRSDLHRYHGNKLFDDDVDGVKITPGHEPCGIVAKTGEGVSKVKEGDRVAIYLGLGCGICPHCLRGDTMLCEEFKCIGFALDGAHADYMVIPEDNCLKMPDNMSFITGALATDVGGTLYTACIKLGVNGSKTVTIFGCGPMGCGGILMAKGFGARVIALDIDDKRLELAKTLGADVTINSQKLNSLEEIKGLTHGHGSDIAIVCAGGNAPLNDAINSVRSQGVVGLIAESNNATIDPSNQFLRKMIDLKGCWYFNRSDWQEISEFIMDKEIQLEKISSHTFPISEAEEAFPLFDSGKSQKVVFIWE